MDASQVYILVAIVILLIIAVIVLFTKKDRKPLSPLAGLAFGFVIAGLFFADNRFLGYSLIGGGIILSVIDIILKSKKK
jgi:uncharacterized membrane protein